MDRLRYESPQANRLTVHGTVDGGIIALELRLLDRKSFDMLYCGFHWIQDYAYVH